jgi:hypothetical protein
MYSYAYSKEQIEITKNCNALLSDVHACNVFFSMVPKLCFPPSMKTCSFKASYAIFVCKFEFKMTFSNRNDSGEMCFSSTQGIGENLG